MFYQFILHMFIPHLVVHIASFSFSVSLFLPQTNTTYVKTNFLSSLSYGAFIPVIASFSFYICSHHISTSTLIPFWTFKYGVTRVVCKTCVDNACGIFGTHSIPSLDIYANAISIDTLSSSILRFHDADR